MTFFPLLFLFSVPISSLSIAFVLMCSIAFTLSGTLFSWRYALGRNVAKQPFAGMYLSNRFLKFVFWGLQPFILILLVKSLLDQGITLNDLVFDLFKTAGRYAELRYSGDVKQTIYTRLVLTLAYISVSLAGLLFAAKNKVRNRLFVAFVAFLPSILIMVTQSSKGAFFLCAAYFYAGILVGRIFKGNFELTNSGTNRSFFLGVMVVFPALVVSFISRGMSDSSMDFIINKLSSYFVSYAFGHVYTFSDWFSWYVGGESLLTYSGAESSYGFYNLMALFQIFGFDLDLPKGVFDDYYFYEGFLKSNIYSVYRGLILDFGLIGSILFMFGLGLFVHLSFYILLWNKYPTFTIAVYIVLIGYIYQSYVISLLNYRSTYLTFALLWLLLEINRLLYLKKDRGKLS